MPKLDLSKFDAVSERARQQIYQRVLDHYKKHPDSPWSGRPLVELEKSLKAYYASMGEEYKECFRDTLPKLMQTFYDKAAKEIGTAGRYKAILGEPDAGRIKYFLDSSYQQVAMRTDKMLFDHIRSLRSLSADVFREATLTGATRREVSKRLLDRALEIKGFEFKDAAGNTWSNKSYFKTLARTELMNAARASYDDKVAEEGFDVMLLTVSGDCCEKCARYEGTLFSLTGATPGLPTKADLEADGVFHPNCTHSYSLVPNYIRQRDYDDHGKPIKNPEPVLYARNEGVAKKSAGGGNQQYASLVKARNESHDAAREAIDKINTGKVKFPDPPVVHLPNPKNAPLATGAYDVQKKQIELYDRCKPVRLAITEVHELVHRLDAKFGLTGSTLLDDFMYEVQMSESIQNYRRARLFVIDDLLKAGKLTQAQYKKLADSLDYILKDEEILARAVSQYIAKKTKNKLLLDGIADIIDSDMNHLGGGQWTDSDFKGIYREVGKLLKAIGISA